MSSAVRPAVAILLPDPEADPVALELHAGGFDPIFVRHGRELAETLALRKEIVLAVIDPAADPDTDLDLLGGARPATRTSPALIVVDADALEDFDPSNGHPDDEYVIRPYSAESIRWRVEARCIRSATARCISSTATSTTGSAPPPTCGWPASSTRP